MTAPCFHFLIIKKNATKKIQNLPEEGNRVFFLHKHCQHAHDAAGSDILLVAVVHTEATVVPFFCSGKQIFAKNASLPLSQKLFGLKVTDVR